MSVTTMPTLAMKSPDKDEPISEILTLNNNVKELKISEKSTMHEGHGLVNGSVGQKDTEEQELTQNGNGNMNIIAGELTDDTDVESRSGDVLSSEISGRMYESEDLIFDDDLSSIARSNSVDYLKEKAIVMLQNELDSARKELKIKDKECEELTTVRSKVEEELEELTASLFEEAHKMVHDANMKQYIAEKRMKEAKGEIEALQTEVSALKSLVLTSTPSNPNPQSHPQLIKKKKDILGSPLRKHRRNRSDAGTTPPQSKPNEQKTIIKMGKEMDSIIMQELSDWLKMITLAPPSDVDQAERISVTNPNVEVNGEYQTVLYETMTPVTSQLLRRIETEDIKPCLTFSNGFLGQKVSENVHNNTLTIEPLSKPMIQQCALSGAMICCKHRIKCGDLEKWFPISQACRTRIASVCDYLTYIRYNEQGLVKHSQDQIYWEINRLRREVALAKLGYYKEE